MKKIKQITAIITVILLISLFVITLLCAIFDPTENMVYFRASVFALVVVPVLLWAYMMLFKYMTRKDDDESDNNSPTE